MARRIRRFLGAFLAGAQMAVAAHAQLNQGVAVARPASGSAWAGAASLGARNAFGAADPFHFLGVSLSPSTMWSNFRLSVLAQSTLANHQEVVAWFQAQAAKGPGAPADAVRLTPPGQDGLKTKPGPPKAGPEDAVLLQGENAPGDTGAAVLSQQSQQLAGRLNSFQAGLRRVIGSFSDPYRTAFDQAAPRP